MLVELKRMPQRPKTICNFPGCQKTSRLSHCDEHQQEADRHREYDRHRGTVTQREYGANWRKIRETHLRREPLCRSCGRPGKIVDHIIPKRAGGTNADGNLQTLCVTCDNRKKHEENKQYGPVKRG